MTPTPDELRQWADNPISGTPMVPVHQNTLRSLADLLEARDVEIERLRKDAERYRWLRQPNPLQRAAHIAVLTKNGGWVASGEQADAAIDAALAQPKEPT